MENENGNGAPGIVPDLTVEIQQWTECFIAFGSAQSIIGAAVQRMRDAATEAERDSIRLEVYGFLRRLALGMLAVAMPGDGLLVTTETPYP